MRHFVFGFQFDRLQPEFERILQLSLCCVTFAQLKVRLHVLRAGRHNSLQQGNSLVRPLSPHQDVSQIVIGSRMVGVFIQSEPEFFLCLRVIDFVVINHSQTKVYPWEIRILFQELLVFLNRFGVFFVLGITFSLQSQHEI